MNTMDKDTKYTADEHQAILNSIDFIYHHQNSTNEEIPEDFLNLWSVKHSGSSSNGEIQILIFTYVLRLTLNSSDETEKMLYTPLFFLLFTHFQIIVNATLYSRKHHISIPPFKIFNIRNYQMSTQEQLLQAYSLITRTPMPDIPPSPQKYDTDF